jgi:hypothetical protein
MLFGKMNEALLGKMEEKERSFIGENGGKGKTTLR